MINRKRKHLEGTIEHEKEQWDTIFESKLKNVAKKPKFSTFWDEDYYTKIKNYLYPLILKYLPKRFFPGYRLDTEHFYDKKTLQDLLINVAKKRGRKVEWIESLYFGNPLPTEFPKSIINTLGKVIDFLFPKNRFLILTVCKLTK